MKRVPLAIASMLPLTVAGYEVGTHALVTKTAYDQSVLAPTHPKSIVATLLLDRADVVTPFRMDEGPTPDRYLDITPLADPLPAPTITISNIRGAHRYEGQLFEGLLGRGYLSEFSGLQDLEVRVPGWLMRGAVREDDNDGGPALIPNVERDLDPHGQVFRALRHFYNPIDNDGFNFAGPCAIYGCRRSTEWALGRTGVLAAPGTVDASRENHFSWQDARNYYWWMLTANYPVGGPLTTKQVAASFGHSIRGMMGASMLKSVGQVVHLVQDTAQPQHVRNDAHSPPSLAVLTLDDSSDGAYEAFTEARIFRELSLDDSSPFAHLQGAQNLSPEAFPPIHLRGNVSYAIPVFRSPDRFFTTRADDSVVANRRGMADVTNRGFFSASTLPVAIADAEAGSILSRFADPVLPTAVGADYQEVVILTSLFADGSVVRSREVTAVVPDVVQPNFNTQSGLFSAYGGQGRVPVLTASQRRKTLDLIDYGVAGPVVNNSGFSIGYNVMIGNADALLPRAVAYSAGLIDHFFRGRLEITPTAQNAFAVLNQGEVHTVDAEGYPRRASNAIFGFERVRLRIRNVTESITESGTSTPTPQTSGSGTLVAIARYHRNACYKPDMAGERIRAYAPPPGIGAITEPSCTETTPVRTDFEEISVSAPVTIASASDLPGGVGSGGSAPAAIEKSFDFSADPIPVNATDLFIQVVYRGQLGDEPDGIAVGSYDVREPTFVGVYNNTDFYWNGTVMQWLGHSGSQFPWRNADYVRVCTGAGGDSRWAYYAEPVAGFPPLGVPSPSPGVIRLAIIFAKPNGAQQFSVRVTPVMSDGLDAYQRSFATPGTQKQANKESISLAVRNAPQFCTQTAPTGSTYWCDDPISKRRGLALGRLVAGVYYDTGFGNMGGDVDAQPLPQFPSLNLTATGTLKWNDPTLEACPPPQTETAASRELIELLERAADEGILID